MTIKDMIPWGNKPVPVRRDQAHPFTELQYEMNRLFDDFWRGFPLAANTWPTALGERFMPRIDMTENDAQFKVTAELPGMDEKDIEVILTGDTLTIKGEKTTDSKDEDRHHTERYYGSFRRTIPLPGAVTADKVTAGFKNGVLTVTLPKAAEAREPVHRVEVKAA